MKTLVHSSCLTLLSRQFQDKLTEPQPHPDWLKELILLQVTTPSWAHTFSQQMTILNKLNSSPELRGISGCSFLAAFSQSSCHKGGCSLADVFVPNLQEKNWLPASACQHQTSDCKSNWTMQSWQDPSEEWAQELPGHCLIHRSWRTGVWGRLTELKN
jgi:hypothetical protein